MLVPLSYLIDMKQRLVDQNYTLAHTKLIRQKPFRIMEFQDGSLRGMCD